MEGQLLCRSNLLPDGHRARLGQTGHSYGVTESLGIAVLSRGHSYGVAGITGHRGAIERLLRSVALPSRNTTPVENCRGCNSLYFSHSLYRGWYFSRLSSGSLMRTAFA